MTATEIAQMTKVERLQTMEAIWDSLIQDNAGIESPEWHQDILAVRKKKIDEGTAQFRSIAALRAKPVK